jgi:uncharacterized PurR-regulated membrane protein YhhQ (DUF165 family)
VQAASTYGVGSVRAFNSEVAVRARIGAARMASETADPGPYRLRSASDASWPGQAVYGHRETFGQKIAGALVAVLRMVFPVLALLASFMAIFLYRDTPVPLFADSIQGAWLTASHLLVPVGFLCVFLTNRRYGPAYAFAQVALAFAAAAAIIVLGRNQIDSVMRPDTIPGMREALAFGLAFFAASFVSTVVFDGARGSQWWTAPFFGFLSAALVFALAFYPAAYAGTDAPWLDHAVKYLVVLSGEGVLMLIPFWALRGIVPPIAGYNGY